MNYSGFGRMLATMRYHLYTRPVEEGRAVIDLLIAGATRTQPMWTLKGIKAMIQRRNQLIGLTSFQLQAQKRWEQQRLNHISCSLAQALY